MNRVLVCGGRDYTNERVLWRVLDRARKAFGADMVLIHGHAKGADSLAGRWAKNRGVDQDGRKADWERHGRAAGPIRNQQMIDECNPNIVIAFPGGRGTADMVRRAEEAGITVYRIGW